MSDKVKASLAVVLILVAVGLAGVRLVQRRAPTRPAASVEAALDELGRLAAEEALRLAGPGGRVALLAFRVPALGDDGPVDLMRRLTDAFLAAGLDVSSPVMVDVDLAGLETSGMALTPDDWSRLFREHADADLLVSLAGIPPRPSAAVEPAPSRRPKTLVIWEASADGLSRAAAGRVDAVIARRLDAQPAEGNYRVIRASSP